MRKLVTIFLLIMSIPLFGQNNANGDELLSRQIASPENHIQQSFDIILYHVRLDLTEAPAAKSHGTCDIHYVWKDEPDTNKFYFHLRGLSIDSAFYGEEKVVPEEQGTPESATYHYSVDPAAGTEKGDTSVLTIYYSGVMTNEGGTYDWGGVSSSGGILFAMGVGFTNNYVSTTQHWMPCYDHPSDKAAYRGEFIVKPGVSVASNGSLTVLHPDNGTDVYVWDHPYQCATYMLTFAAAEFDSVKFGNGDIPIVCYTTSGKMKEAAEFYYRRVPRMVDTYSRLFGEYPYEKVGFVNTPKGNMEHQTMISMDAGLIFRRHNLNDSNDNTAAHELSHQWFGGLVTPADFRDAWLNEGFAVFCEALWLNELHGKEKYLNFIDRNMELYISDIAVKEGIFPLYDFKRTSPSSNYPQTIYKKGAVVVGMLKYELGDSTFFEGIRTYLDRYAHGNVTTEKLKTTLEDVSGKDLDYFFDQWVYRKSWPDLDINIDKTFIEENNVYVTVHISQIQPEEYGIYTKLPVEIGFETDTGCTCKMLTMNEENQSFELGEMEDFEDVTINEGPSVRALLEADVTVTSVEDRSAITDNSIRVFPNPTDGVLNMKYNSTGGKTIFKMISTLGVTMYEREVFSSEGKNHITIDADNLPGGSYLLIFEENGKNKTINVKIVK